MMYLARKAIAALITILVLSFVVFSIIRLIPGDPLSMLANPFTSQSTRQAIRQELGLDEPLLSQYLEYMKRIVLNGDFGRSFKTGERVLAVVRERAPATLMLAGSALVISYAVAFLVAIPVFRKPGGAADLVGVGVSVLGISVPSFWLGFLLMLAFSVKLGVLPVAGYGTWQHLILPVLTLAAEGTGANVRMLRTSLLEVRTADYVRTARAKGLREIAVLVRHGLRNGLIPLVTLLGLRIGWLIGGAVIVEEVFAWPGLGRTLVESLLCRDYPLFQGIMLVLCVAVVLGNAMAEVLYVIADPRIRHS